MLFNSISVQCLQTSRDFVMSTLCLGDSHVVRFGDFIGNTNEVHQRSLTFKVWIVFISTVFEAAQC